MIARRTLIAKQGAGGLDLIDISAKRDALRVKLIARFLDNSSQHPWKDALADLLAGYGERSSYNLCAFAPREVTEGLPGFYREVLEAWDKFLPHLRPDVEYKEQVLQIPFLHSPFFPHKGRPMMSRALRLAGRTSLGSVCGGHGGLTFDLAKTVAALRGGGGAFKRQQVAELGMSIQAGIGAAWKGLKQRGREVRGDAVGFLLCQGGREVPVGQLKTKVIYSILVSKLTKRPASEPHWAALFPGRDPTTIWGNLRVPFMPHTVFNTNFKLRHRRYYTCIVLHQIHKLQHSRLCAVCGVGEEDFAHLCLECPELAVYRGYIRQLLVGRCGVGEGLLKEWDWVWLFGLPRQGGGPKAMQANTVLALARHAVVLRRNLAVFERKIVAVRALFRNLLRAHLGLLHVCKEGWFREAFLLRTSLVELEGNGKLRFLF